VSPLAPGPVSLYHLLEVVSGERVREAVVGRREGLVVLSETAALESVEDPINMRLPDINGPELPDELRQRIWIAKEAGHHNWARILSDH